MEELTLLIIKNFYSKNDEIYNAISILKDKIQIKYPKLFSHKILLSPVHKTDKWNIINKNGKYIVAADIYPENICNIRYLLRISNNNIYIYEKMLVNIDISKNIIY